ncbi:MAG: YhbY family RNA-binding protein [Mogibacterium sp.]|nr:YhbY family RNA-binding protein [Mogibacterium sp.]
MLTGKQRSYLKKLAMDIEPAVNIGKADLTETVIRAIDDYLEAHELVKVKIQEGSLLDPKETCNELAEMLNAEFVQAIGRKFVLFRPSSNIKNRKIVI